MKLTLILLVTLLFTGFSSAQGNKSDTTYITFHKIDKAWKYSKGNNVRVAILDWLFDMSPKASDKYVDPVSLVPGQHIGELKPWHGEWMAEIVHSIAPGAKIIPIRARPKSSKDHPQTLDYQPYEKYLIEGIKYAADHGACVVTSSMGPLKQTRELNEAIKYAQKKGTVFVDVHPEYKEVKEKKLIFCDSLELNPLIIHPGVVSVPAHPVKISSTIIRDFYTWPYDIDPVYEDGWGFSNAPPIVAGVIALMKSVNPGLNIKEIKNILIKTSVMNDGFNIVDAEAAVKEAIKFRKK